MKSIALIPARCGSQRIKNKNILAVNGHPLIAYAIKCAIDSSIFESVHVCTDSQDYADIAIKYGAICKNIRPASTALSNSPDCEWISWFFNINKQYRSFDFASIIRPTSPFRKPSTIKKAFKLFLSSSADTLRAVKPISEHPGKMWVRQGAHIIPLLPFSIGSVPLHSNQTNALFECFVQDASLEIFTISNFLASGSITGNSILPFFNEGYEGFDLNVPDDVRLMNSLISANVAQPYGFSDVN